jgi:NAD(P)-dependent dehydrogenase (short-subunit alcohol dehydrogenase family)
MLGGFAMLCGKNVIVTGGSRGNGEGIALGMLANHANVFVFDKLCGSNDAIHYVKVDLMDFEKVEIAFKKIVESFGTIDILVNNAGVSYGNSSEKYSIDDWNKTIGVNLTVPFNMSKMVANELIKKEKSGSIINITSLGAEFGFPENPAYCASKGGLKQLTKALAYDWAKYGIRVNNVGPGYMHTNMTDKSYNNPQMNAERLRHMMIQRWGEPRDLAGVCVFLASQMSEYITGQDIYVDGGWTAKGL